MSTRRRGRIGKRVRLLASERNVNSRRAACLAHRECYLDLERNATDAIVCAMRLSVLDFQLCPNSRGKPGANPTQNNDCFSALIGGTSTLLPTGPTTVRNGHLCRFGASGIAEKVSPLHNRG